jgi:hypothetical protein
MFGVYGGEDPFTSLLNMRKEKKRLYSHYPFQGHSLNDLKPLTRPCLLKDPLSLNTAALRNTLFSCGLLGDTQDPNYSSLDCWVGKCEYHQLIRKCQVFSILVVPFMLLP